MNTSRIQQLKVQACKWAAENTCSKEYENACDEKFAELIVRECARVSATKAGTFDEGSFVAKRIKEHFGVEE